MTISSKRRPIRGQLSIYLGDIHDDAFTGIDGKAHLITLFDSAEGSAGGDAKKLISTIAANTDNAARLAPQPNRTGAQWN
ncbi:MAG: hypothetical protein ACU0DI_07390 [Paracoccaceae bacterium]